jgi:FMN phosphatase YigB (HAD superfamily)
MKTILVDAYNTFVTEGEGIFKEMHVLLETFPNKKIVLTNANDEQFQLFGFDKVPYEIFTLKHNPDKVDLKYYEAMLAQFGLIAADVVYFEHNIDAVKSALSVGIKTYHYDKDAKDLKALEAFLRENA